MLTPEESFGRKLTLVVSLMVGVPPLLLLAMWFLPGSEGIRVSPVSLGIVIVMSVILFLGYRWARAYFMLSLSIIGLLYALGSFFAPSFMAAMVPRVLATLDIVAVLILWKSKAVDAYFDSQTKSRDELPSLKDLGDA